MELGAGVVSPQGWDQAEVTHNEGVEGVTSQRLNCRLETWKRILVYVGVYGAVEALVSLDFGEGPRGELHRSAFGSGAEGEPLDTHVGSVRPVEVDVSQLLLASGRRQELDAPTSAHDSRSVTIRSSSHAAPAA